MKVKAKKCNNKRKTKSIKVELTLEEKIDRRVKNYVRNLRWGSGANEKMRKMIQKALDNPCYYCGEQLTIDNIQLDHKKPMYRTIKHSSKELKKINNPRNLRFICWHCNFIKDTMPDRLFKKLMDFLNTDWRLKRSVSYKMFIAAQAKIPPKFE